MIRESRSRYSGPIGERLTHAMNRVSNNGIDKGSKDSWFVVVVIVLKQVFIQRDSMGEIVSGEFSHVVLGHGRSPRAVTQGPFDEGNSAQSRHELLQGPWRRGASLLSLIHI